MTPVQLLRRFLVLLMAAFLCLQLVILAQVFLLRYRAPADTAFMREQLARLQEKNPNASIRFVWRDLPAINRAVQRAAIAGEDSRFMLHDGFDWEGIRHAMRKNQRAGHLVAGGSTITQQLAKNLFLSGRRTLVRKGEETLITLMLDACLTKKRTLELYLNVAQFGERVFGIEAASQHYFGTSASHLSTWQAANLIARLPSPGRYDRLGNTAWLLEKTAIIHARMPLVYIPR